MKPLAYLRARSPLVVAFGGGVNSAAMLIGMHERGIKPDLITFADTGGEKPETYDYLSVVNRWLEARGWLNITVVRNDGMYTSLEDNCLKQKMLPSLAYGFKSCSDKYKRRPQDKFVKGWATALGFWDQVKVTRAIGYDAGEPHRAIHIEEDDHFRYWYPLIEWQWARRECVEAIERAGLEVPPKSACFYCPASKKSEILWLHNNHPDLFRRAVDMEKNAELTSVKGLGRNYSAIRI